MLRAQWRRGALARHERRLARGAGGWLHRAPPRYGDLRPPTREGGDPQMSVFQRIGAFFSLRDEEDELFEEETRPGTEERRKVVPFQQGRTGDRSRVGVALFVPRAFNEVTEIADALRGRRLVVMNLQNADRQLLQRVVDFVAGVAYTLDGKMQKLADGIYLVVPAGVDVDAVNQRLENDAFAGEFDGAAFGGKR
ncbi:cell division protein SepF [bacterium]|nr:MAG: cell division protein SepF [bacterium]